MFPTIQTCEQGEAAWIQVAEDGASEADLELPAPAFVVTAAEPGGWARLLSNHNHGRRQHRTQRRRVEHASGLGDCDRALTLAALGARPAWAPCSAATALVLQRRRT